MFCVWKSDGELLLSLCVCKAVLRRLSFSPNTVATMKKNSNRNVTSIMLAMLIVTRSMRRCDLLALNLMICCSLSEQSRSSRHLRRHADHTHASFTEHCHHG